MFFFVNDPVTGTKKYNYGKTVTVYSKVCPQCNQSNFSQITENDDKHSHCNNCNVWMKIEEDHTHCDNECTNCDNECTNCDNECTHCGHDQSSPMANGGSIRVCRQCNTVFDVPRPIYSVTFLESS